MVRGEKADCGAVLMLRMVTLLWHGWLIYSLLTVVMVCNFNLGVGKITLYESERNKTA